MENINSWDDIQWRDIEVKVFRLQMRIFKAATNQEFTKMYKLQKLLMKSKFARFLSVRRVTQENLGKRTPGLDKKLITTSNERYSLANRLLIDGKSSPIRKVYLEYSDGKQRSLGIPTIEDRSKQMLVYLALCPEWEARFEANSYGFRPGRSVQDALEEVFLGISKKPKWVFEAAISKCFDKINHEYLLTKCNTFPKLRKQLKVWLKAGILDTNEVLFSEEGGVISPLLANIALHGLKEQLDIYINSLGDTWPNNRQSLTYVRYADDLVIMHPDNNTLKGIIPVIKKFLEPIGLELHQRKTRIIHTREKSEDSPPGFTFLGFDIIQRDKRVKQSIVKAFHHVKKSQEFITLITPSKKGVKYHKTKIRTTIQKYQGASQERLIQVLNPIILKWANSKRSQASSKIFQTLDAFLWIHLWKWARKRHPKMAKIKLKEMYWQKVGKRNWVFGLKKNDFQIIQLQIHSKISIQRHAKIKGTASVFDGNFLYWSKRT